MAVIMKLSKNALIAQNTTNKAVNNCHGHNAIDFDSGSMSEIKSIPCYSAKFTLQTKCLEIVIASCKPQISI